MSERKFRARETKLPPKPFARGASRQGLLLLRADGGPSIGAGHVMRCLALADGWTAAGGRALLATAERPAFYDSAAEARLPTVSVEAVPGSAADAAFIARLARETNATWVALDGYVFDDRYRSTVRGAGLPLLVIDDQGHFGPCTADAILNANLHATRALYPSVGSTTRLLLGPRYAMLRREFWPWASRRFKATSKARRLLVLLGGSDTGAFVRKLAAALEPLRSEGFEITLAGITTSGDMAASSNRLAASDGAVRFAAAAEDVPRLMAHADLAFSAAGTTSWELAFMGVPALLVSIAENQRRIAESLDRAGAAIDLGWHGDLDPAALTTAIRDLAASARDRERLSEASRRLVDGRGNGRVVTYMRGYGPARRLVRWNRQRSRVSRA